MNIRSFLLFFVLILQLTPLLAAPSPWDSWRSGYTSYEQGETLRDKGNYTEAIKLFEKSKSSYLAVRTARPDWNQRVIAERIADCDRQIAAVRQLLASGGRRPRPTPAPSAQQTAVSRQPGTTSKPPSTVSGTTAPKPSGSAPAVDSNIADFSITEYNENLQKLNTRNAALLKELEKIRKELAAKKAENETLQNSVSRQRAFEQEISNLMRDRRIASEKYSLLEQRCKRLEADLAKPTAKLKDIEQRLVAERQKLDDMTRRTKLAEQKLDVSEKRFKESVFAVTTLEKRLKTAEQENKRLTSSLEHSGEAAKAFAEKERDLRRKLDDAEKRLKSFSELLAAKDKNKVDQVILDSLKRDIAGRDERLVILQKDIDSLGAALQAERTASRSLREEKAILNTELDALRKKSAETENDLEKSAIRCKDLERDVKILSERSSALEKRLALRNNEDFQAAATARETCRKLEKDILTLQNELIELRNTINSKETKISDLERSAKSSKAELLATKTREIGFRDRLAEAEKELTTLRAAAEKLTALERNFAALSAENRENKALAEAAKPREAELARIKLRLLDNDRLKSDLVKEQQLNEDLKNEVTRNRGEIKTLRSRVVELNAAKRRIAELEALEVEVKRLQALQDQVNSLAGREQELAALKIKYGEIETLLANARNSIKNLSDEKRTITAERNRFRAENDKIPLLQRRNQELDELIKNQTAELNTLNEKIIRLQSDSDNRFAEEHRRELDALRKIITKIGPLNDELNKIRNEKLALDKKLQAADAAFEQFRVGSAETLRNKDAELSRLRTLNAELADYRKNSTAALADKAEKARLARLNDEVEALTKLNAELAAERDKVTAELDNLRRGITISQSPIKISDSPEELASAGVLAESSGSIELAIWNYRQAIEANPDFSPAHLRLGTLLFSRNDYKGALPHLSAARAAKPDDLELTIKTIRCQLALKRFGNARSLLVPLLKKHPENPIILMLTALADAASGATTQAEGRLITASRLAPDNYEIKLELSRLLATQVTDRTSEAVAAYERARELGAAPDVQLEKLLGEQLDRRRNLTAFLSGAAAEAELVGDWGSSVWYYRQLIGMKREEFVPYLALAQMKNGNIASARETLEFNQPSRLGMAVLTLIELHDKNNTAALRSARQAAGAVLPPAWVGMKLELEKLAALKHPDSSVRILLANIKR